MKKKINALLFSCVIVMSGYIFSNLDGASPFLVLSFLALILFYHEKPEYVRNRRMSGVVLAWLLLLWGTYDSSVKQYDIKLPPIFDVVAIIIGYPIGYLLGYIYGAAKRDLWDKD